MPSAIEYRRGDATVKAGAGPWIIAHVCNDIGKWGKGFVLAISRRWPEPEAEYRRAARSCPLKLGQTQFVQVGPELAVVNMIAQRGIRRRSPDPCALDYRALGACLDFLASVCLMERAGAQLPRIGTGLAGGNWGEVELLLQRHLCRLDVPVVVFDWP